MPQNELVILGAFMSQRDAKQYLQHKSFQEGKVIWFSQQSKIRHRHASSRPVTIIATLLEQCENRHIDIRSHNQGGTVQRVAFIGQQYIPLTISHRISKKSKVFQEAHDRTGCSFGHGARLSYTCFRIWENACSHE